MKKCIVYSFLVFIFGLLFVLSPKLINAKTVSSNDFSVSVGTEDKIYATMQNVVHEEETKSQIHFLVSLNKDKEEVKEDVYNFIWTHKFEVYEDGTNLLYEEQDVMPSKVNGEYPLGTTFYNKNTKTDVYFSKEGVLFKNYDIDPNKNYTIKFYNSFSCIDCPAEYQHKEQVLETMTLTLAYDDKVPTVDLSSLTDIIETTNGVRTVVNGSTFNVTYADEDSGIREAYYIFTDYYYYYVDDLLNYEETYSFYSGETMKVEIESSSYGEGYLQTQTIFGPQYITYYAYIVVTDYSGKVYANYVDFNLYVEKDKNDIVYDGNISEEGAYKAIDIDITTEFDTYYSFSTSSYEPIKNITKKYSSKVTLGTGENGEYYLHIIQKDGDNIYKLSRKYTIDNNAPIINEDNSTYSEVDKVYRSVSIQLQVIDVYTIENVMYLGTGVTNVYYSVFTKELTDSEYDLININYPVSSGNEEPSENGRGAKLTFDNLENGTHYIYFKMVDYLGNTGIKCFKYIIDKEPPVITIGNYSNDDTASVDPYVSFSVSGTMESSFKCGWFIEGYTPKYSELELTCKSNENIVVSGIYEGKYKLWIHAQDEAGNTIMNNSPSVLVDRKGPTISVVNGYSPDSYRYSNNIEVSIVDGLSNVQSGVKYGWFKSGDQVSEELLTNELDLTNPVINYPLGLYGTYNIYVLAKDTLNNSTFYKVDTLYYIDTDKIILNLHEDEVITIIKNKKYEEFGAFAYKENNPNIKISVTIKNNVNTSKAGKYTVVYTAGEGELQQTITRTVIVEEVNQYYIIAISTFGVGVIISIVVMIIRGRKEKQLFD